MGGISAKRMYNFCSHQKCHVAVYEVARIFCRKCTAWGQEQCGMGTHGNGEKKIWLLLRFVAQHCNATHALMDDL